MWPLNSSYRTGPLGWRQCSEFTWWRWVHQWFRWALPRWPLPGKPSRTEQDGNFDPSHTADDQRGREPSAATQDATGRLRPRQSSQSVLYLLTNPPLPTHHAQRGVPWPRSPQHRPSLWAPSSPWWRQSARPTWQWWKHNQPGISVSSQQPQLWRDPQVEPLPHQRLHADGSVAPSSTTTGEPADLSSPGEAATGQASSLCFDWVLPGAPVWLREPAELLGSGLWRSPVWCGVPCEDAGRADARTQGHLSYHNQRELTISGADRSCSLSEDVTLRWCFTHMQTLTRCLIQTAGHLKKKKRIKRTGTGLMCPLWLIQHNLSALYHTILFSLSSEDDMN